MRSFIRRVGRATGPLVASLAMALGGAGPSHAAPAPTPLTAAGHPVQWWFAYKFSSSAFATDIDDPARACPFGGTPRRVTVSAKPKPYLLSQRYIVASSDDPTLKDRPELIGTSDADPLGATFGQIFNGAYDFVTWNDQFHGSPIPDRGLPWGHSKGFLAWNENGEGLMLQVTTPDWPGAGSAREPRATGNTLGCVEQNNVTNAQHFFALKLTPEDLRAVLRALDTASVVTDPARSQLVNLSGAGAALPGDLQTLVDALKKPRPSDSTVYGDVTLSSGVRLIAKPSALAVPPWQFVSSVLGGAPLRTATWWASPKIPTTTKSTKILCWDTQRLHTKPGAVQIATSGHWDGQEISLTGAPNHAKIGVSNDGGATHYAIFGDLNQQGKIADPTTPLPKRCHSSQNNRGGLFFVIDNATLSQSVAGLIAGRTAPKKMP